MAQIPAIPATAQPTQTSRPQTPNQPITQNPNILKAPKKPAQRLQQHTQPPPFPILHNS